MAEILKFPKELLWGTATSAYQVEGGIENSDWSSEFPAGRACDHYNLYEKDFDLLKKLNQNAYRFSIEWSRIEPKEGEFNKKEIEHYRKVLLTLKKRNIKTIVTLHHFTNPQWLTKKGGWANSKVVFYFSRFARKIFEEFSDLVDFWVTINEPLVYASLGYFQGRWPPHKKDFLSLWRVIKNQIKVHKNLYQTFHKLDQNIRIGIAKNNNYFEPFNPDSPFDKLLTIIHRYFWNEYFLNRIQNHLDFIGLNYYSRNKVGVRLPFQEESKNKIELTDIKWEIYPQGIYHILKELRKYTLPIYITENGLADAEDKLRKDFIKNHLFWIYKAIQEKIDVRGYFHWSLMDNFEWDKGFEPRFGLVEIDYKTLKRKIRKSAKFYAKISKENTLQLTTNN